MATKNWIGLIGIIFLALVVPQVLAFPYTATLDSPSTISLSENTSISLPLVIHNSDFETHTFVLVESSDEDGVTVTPSFEEVTLSPYESTTIGLTVRATKDADHDLYNLSLRVSSDGQLVEIPIHVYVGTNPFVTIGTFSKTVCGNEYVEPFSISIKNNSATEKNFTIQADQPILFPYTGKDHFILGAGKTTFATFNANVSPENEGKFSGTIRVETEDIISVNTFSLTVDNCPIFPEKLFSMTLPKNPKKLTKLETTLIPVTLENLTEEPQTLTLFANSVIPSDTKKITLSGDEKIIVYVPFNPSLNTKSGKYTTEFVASSTAYTTSQTITLEVLPLDYIELESVSTVYEITKGDTHTIQFIVHNSGDTAQDIVLSTQDNIATTAFSFNASAFKLLPYSSRIVDLKITVEDNSSLAHVSTAILAKGNKKTVSLPLEFDVTKIPTGLIGVEFISGPEKITIGKHDSKEIQFIIHNPTETSITGISYRLLRVTGAGIVISGNQNTALAPLETKTLTFTLETINTTHGQYHPILVLESAKGVGSIPFAINVTQDDFFGLAGIGLFLFSGTNNLGFIVLVLIIVGMGVWYMRRDHFPNPAWANNAE